MKMIYPLIGCVTFGLTAAAAAGAGPLADVLAACDFTRECALRRRLSDPAELKVQISTDQIDSKVGVCKFLDAKADGKRRQHHVECQLPAGPLMGDITFTQKPNDTIDFVDRDRPTQRPSIAVRSNCSKSLLEVSAELLSFCSKSLLEVSA